MSKKLETYFDLFIFLDFRIVCLPDFPHPEFLSLISFMIGTKLIFWLRNISIEAFSILIFKIMTTSNIVTLM